MPKAIVLDVGSTVCKSGFSGECTPILSPSVVGTAKYEPVMSALELCPKFVGSSAIDHRGILRLSFNNLTLENSANYWNYYTDIYHDVYEQELRVASEEFPVVSFQHPFEPHCNLEKKCEILFEEFNIPGYSNLLEGEASAQVYARKTCLMVSSGASVTSIMPFYQGSYISTAASRLNYGGNDVTEYLVRCCTLARKIHSNWTSHPITKSELSILNDMKETLGYVAEDPSTELSPKTYCAYSYDKNAKEYQWPDGTVECVGEERFQCAEIIFNPKLLGKWDKGLHLAVQEVINNCPIHCRKELLDDICLAGGNTMMVGFPERLLKELKLLFPNNEVNVHALPERHFASWWGGSIISSLGNFARFCSKEEYEEYGPVITLRNCF